MGDHTDYAGGLVLPMAIQLGTTVTGRRGGDRVVLRSDWAGDALDAPLDSLLEPGAARSVEPTWARLVAGVVAEVRPTSGFVGTISSTLPVGGGLSSSAALAVATALALGGAGPAPELAAAARRAEQAATGVPCGIMDQLASAAGVAGHALRIDCAEETWTPIPVADDVVVLVVDSGVERHLARTPYAERVAETLAALADRGPAALRRRARHVRSENERVDALAGALGSGDRGAMRDVLAASHASLRDDAEVSTPALDELVEHLTAAAGVIGARLTGAGFGGCVVALLDRGHPAPAVGGRRAWLVTPSAGATCA
jgi:galactokinase